MIVGVICASLSLLASRVGKTILYLAFASFGIFGGPFLGLVMCAYRTVSTEYFDMKVDSLSNSAFRPFASGTTVIVSTLISLSLCSICGFGSVLGLKEKFFSSHFH